MKNPNSDDEHLPLPVQKSSPLVAHIAQDDSCQREESLQQHLFNVAFLARGFSNDFGMPCSGDLLGRVHDFGKASNEFQVYLRAQCSCVECIEDVDERKDIDRQRLKGPDHSTAGARWLAQASSLQRAIGELLAYVVAGHHAGLPDGLSATHSQLRWRIEKKQIPKWEENAQNEIPQSFFQVDSRLVLSEFGTVLLPDPLSIAGRLRMLFSALVDADFLATENFVDSARTELRQKTLVPLGDLEQKLNQFLETFKEKVEVTPVDQIRHEIRKACLRAADQLPGLFTLEVPTGGGKTLSSMAFALKHARLHGLKRVIYVVPYTSIIEQNAEVFRRIFGPDVVLEHHSNRDLEQESERTRLLSENWDVPIVVTTNVQFFESLYANRSARCRKLHNLAQSVIVLDEAQSLPASFLRPCLHALDELMCNCGSSVVVCTATLPAFFRGDFHVGRKSANRMWNGLAGNKEGRRDIAVGLDLERRLCRVSVERLPGKISDEDLSSRLSGEASVLAIVSTRRHARLLFELTKRKVGTDSIFHLSGQMCPAHRLDVLARVKILLQRKERCILITTQLVEAGVDIDFPCVYRELAGCDSMVQAAGRCNREGCLTRGRVVIFESSEDQAIPAGDLTQAADKGREVIDMPEFADGVLSVDAVRTYFRLRYNDLDEGGSLDAKKIGELFAYGSAPYGFQFKTCADRFQLIPEQGITVYVPYDQEGRDLCEAFRAAYSLGEQRRILRRLVRYGVTVHGCEPRDREGNLYADRVHDLAWILTSPELNYSTEFGLSSEPLEMFLRI